MAAHAYATFAEVPSNISTMLSISKSWWWFLYRRTFNDVYWQGDPHCEILVNRVVNPSFLAGSGNLEQV